MRPAWRNMIRRFMQDKPAALDRERQAGALFGRVALSLYTNGALINSM